VPVLDLLPAPIFVLLGFKPIQIRIPDNETLVSRRVISAMLEVNGSFLDNPS
jgi:hypothetical protein